MDIKTIDGKAPGASENTAFTIGFKMPVRPIDANALCEGRVCNDPVRIAAMCADTLSLNTLRDAIYQDAVEHGLWEEHDNIWWPQECHSLIENEADELYDTIEDWVNGHGNERFTEELADVIIMSMSVAGKLGIDIDAAIRRKMEINKGRPWKHGKSNE